MWKMGNKVRKRLLVFSPLLNTYWVKKSSFFNQVADLSSKNESPPLHMCLSWGVVLLWCKADDFSPRCPPHSPSAVSLSLSLSSSLSIHHTLSLPPALPLSAFVSFPLTGWLTLNLCLKRTQSSLCWEFNAVISPHLCLNRFSTVILIPIPSFPSDQTGASHALLPLSRPAVNTSAVRQQSCALHTL